ncbi:AAA family ATPase [Haloarchaeobius sp. FL176]|uniref:AAA family ATPase n=1 Tax=Haloarchaeobius sp. FL176 TaxID=2967129 RepID=UPI0021472AF1|nr:AAA family ATPase [Haloarchaeobius sp. FL176]
MPERDEVIDEILERVSEEGVPEEHTDLCESLLVDNYGSLEYSVDELKLRHLDIENFRVIKENSIDFGNERTILFGENEEGKTSSLEAVRFNLLGRQEDQRIKLTGPIRDGKSTLVTTGNWSVDGSDHLIRRTLTNGSGYSETIRLNTDPQDLDDLGWGSPNTQEEVSRAVGLWPIESKQLGRYNTFSLFCLMPGNFKIFLKWQKKSKYLDMLFGINLASVITESSRYRNNELELSEDEKTAAEDLADVESRVSKLQDDIESLQGEQEQVEAKLNDRKSELRRTQDLLGHKDELEDLEAQETEIKRQINKLQDERQEYLSQLRTVEQKINRYQEMDMGEHLHEPSQELQKYMSVPDRCPICTNEVDDDQRRRLLNDGDCPLCRKSVPSERIEVGTERDVEEKIVEREQREEALEEAQEQRQRIQGEIELLESRIDDYETELENVRAQIQQSDEKELLDRKNELQSTVEELNEKATNLQIELNAKRETIEDMQEDRLPELEEVYESRKKKVEKKDSLKTFERVVQNQINREREEIRTNLATTMENLLDIFEEGTLSDAFTVDFDSDGGYDFTIRVRDGDDIPSDRPNENSNEGKLTALLFHTAVLNQLTKHGDTLPLRLFIIDSPYSESPDTRNTPDITNFLQQLPDFLPEFQLILGIADTNMADKDAFSDQYNIVNF